MTETLQLGPLVLSLHLLLTSAMAAGFRLPASLLHSSTQPRCRRGVRRCASQ